MTSKDLQKDGFIEWHLLAIGAESELLRLIPESDGAYVIRAYEPFGRYRGQSDIVYIGSSSGSRSGLKGRLTFYFRPGPTQYTSKRIKALLDRQTQLEISFKVCPGVVARSLEKDILGRYVNDHWELPPYNRNEPH